MGGKQRKYNLLYLPAGKLVEVLGPSVDGKNIKASWHTLSKNRSDLKVILNRVLQGGFPSNFYTHNEMPIPTPYGVSGTINPQKVLQSCHFIFQRADLTPKESQND